MYGLIRDLRQAIRGFGKSPGTTAIIIVALALGIGFNVSSFIFVEGIVLHPFSFPELDRLMMVCLDTHRLICHQTVGVRGFSAISRLR
jgi:hypothetical protein